MKNYFKVLNNFIFFNDAKVVDTQAAFTAALAKADGDPGLISIYELPVNAGPWDRVGIVGHRRRGDILRDIASEEDAVLVGYREEELDRLDRLYYAAGRDCIPLFGVAA